jgi:hypothetical protein
MALSAFDDKTHIPEPAELAAKLGRSARYWDALIADFEQTYAPLARDWSFSGAKYGWSLRLKQKKRAVVYLAPGEGQFLASFALGEKAVAALQGADLPAKVVEIVDTVPRYAEGRGVRIPVRTKADLQAVKTIAAAKMSA